MRIARLLTLLLLASLAPLASAAQDPPVLRVGTKEAPPFAMRDGDSWRGLSIDLWNQVAAELGYETEYVELGLEEMLDGVSAGEVDLAVAALTISPEREERMDFTHALHTSGLGIAARTSAGSPFGAVLARLISGEFLSAVAALAALLLGCGALVWFFERRANAEEFGGDPVRGLCEGFWWSAVTMTTVGYGDRSPRTLGGRVVGLVWMFASILLISGFTGAIASSLTVDRLRSSIQGAEDLYDVRVGSVDESASAAWLDAERVSYRSYDDVSAAMDALGEGELDAVVYDAPMLRWLASEKGLGEVQVLPELLDRQLYAFALPTGSEQRKPINQALMQIVGSAAWEETLVDYLGE